MPLEQTWSHIIANISVGLQLGDKLIFQSFKDGISFSTLPTSEPSILPYSPYL
jgi:hypothetical protein